MLFFKEKQKNESAFSKKKKHTSFKSDLQRDEQSSIYANRVTKMAKHKMSIGFTMSVSVR